MLILLELQILLLLLLLLLLLVNYFNYYWKISIGMVSEGLSWNRVVLSYIGIIRDIGFYTYQKKQKGVEELRSGREKKIIKDQELPSIQGKGFLT